MIALNHLTWQDKRNCNCRHWSYHAHGGEQRKLLAPGTRPPQSGTLPVSSIGGKACLDEARAILKTVDGVKSACLFFKQTALHVSYARERTHVKKITVALQRIDRECCELRKIITLKKHDRSKGQPMIKE